MYLYWKALHIIFVIIWFSGTFYIVRLFIYHTEAMDKSKLERSILIPQYQLMQRRLWYIITWPGAILSLIFGCLMLYQNPSLLTQTWMKIKIVFLIFLFIYHLKNHSFFIQLQNNRRTLSTAQFRYWNELATLFLFSIVSIAILKNVANWATVIIWVGVLAFLLVLGIKLYKKLRD